MRSMTGFGRSEAVVGNFQFSMEMKSVNHRFLDLRFRLPPALNHLESLLSESIRKSCERGSIEIVIRQKLTGKKGSVSSATRFLIDEGALESLLKATKKLEKDHGIENNLNVASLLSSGKVLVAVDDQEGSLLDWEQIRPLADAAVEQLLQMRETEGKNLKKTLQGILGEIKELTDAIEKLKDQQPARIHERLQSRLAQWKIGEQIDASRLAWEVALLAEKADITEEIDRLGSHVKAFLSTLGTKNSVGRRLDFLTQELLRECNTIASKTNLMEITERTVLMKAQIERLREQVQNVE